MIKTRTIAAPDAPTVVPDEPTPAHYFHVLSPSKPVDVSCEVSTWNDRRGWVELREIAAFNPLYFTVVFLDGSALDLRPSSYNKLRAAWEQWRHAKQEAPSESA